MPSKINYGLKNLEAWNPIVTYANGKRGWHCTKISDGCKLCYAESMNLRTGNKIPYDDSLVSFGIDEKVLAKPLSWKKPRTIFVQNMGDLFHEGIGSDVLIQVFNMIRQSLNQRGHRFLILTKRIGRVAYLQHDMMWDPEGEGKVSILGKGFRLWPILTNLWLGVTVCNQQEADEKIPILLSIPAAHRWISIEPMLGEIDLMEYFTEPYEIRQATYVTRDMAIDAGDRSFEGQLYQEAEYEPRIKYPQDINWVVVGSESGPRRRPADNAWIRSIIDQCQSANVPVYVKQIESGGKLIKDPALWPQEVPQQLAERKEI